MTKFVDRAVTEVLPILGLTKRGVQRFRSETQLRVFVDENLMQCGEVCSVAGTWHDNFGAAPAEIVRVAGGVVSDLKRF